VTVHTFDTGLAEKYGVTEAIILQNLIFWIEHNKANNKNFNDGHYWTYNSVRAWCELFPYLTSKKIRGALDRLEKEGVIKSGNYNKAGYDKTKWYTVLLEPLPKGQMDLPKKANGFTPKGEPIPDINTNEKPDIIYAPFDDFYSIYPRKKDKAKAQKIWHKLKIEKDSEIHHKIIYHVSNAYLNTDKQYIPYPTTYLNGRRWEDEIDIKTTSSTRDEDFIDMQFNSDWANDL